MTGSGEDAQGLTIGQLARSTEVSPATLRAWESRYGFPSPRRGSGGQRRYTDADRAAVAEVVRLRRVGLSLPAAVERANRTACAPARSIQAALRKAELSLPVHRLDRRTMLAISRAIEDDCCARAERPVLIGAFQTRDRFVPVEPRWRELARTARVALVLARSDGTSQRPSQQSGSDQSFVHVPLGDASPATREWAVVCDSPDAVACLCGWEVPESAGPRRFEATWTVEPSLVRVATLAAFDLARAAGVEISLDLEELPPTDPADVLRRSVALTNRIVADVARR